MSHRRIAVARASQKSARRPRIRMSNSAPDSSVLDRIYTVIESRRGADPDTSNTARLFAKGTEKIAQKLGEEAVETVIEGVRGRKKELIAESADLLYHLLVLWADRGVKPRDVWEELSQREGISGLLEKMNRKGE
jgi:phosphoribosyl-ATP pyrophosphohydrolase